MSRDEDFQKLMKNVMSKVIENLGPNVDKVRYELSETISRFSSTIYFIPLRYENKTKKRNEEFFITLKRPFQDHTLLTHIDRQFHNEIVFYQMYTRSDENYAKCLYTDERPPTDSVIVLENVNKRGYYPCSYKYNVPLEYTLAAMRELGRFHGKGYAMKELQREKFFDIVTRLEESRYYKSAEKSLHEILSNVNSTRAVEYLRNNGHDAVFCDKMETLLSNAFDEVMMKTVKPLEPLATLCHGDFTVDNVLFKTEDDGQYRAMLIDFASFRYSTPVVDLSTYLCLCCSNEMRKDKFSEILRTYHNALKEYLLEAGVWDIEKYSYEALLEDYKRGGLFGYVIATYYLPLLLGYYSPDLMTQEDSLNIGMFQTMRGLEYNDELCKILADMLLNLTDVGCLKYIT